MNEITLSALFDMTGRQALITLPVPFTRFDVDALARWADFYIAHLRKLTGPLTPPRRNDAEILRGVAAVQQKVIGAMKQSLAAAQEQAT